ncbi:multidrug effflux MFS transporter [Salinarimonas ramus]|uniref:Bcr/CflA family efflux transporter n=1 Tax=Salinarimonas ramus TaxID=690164 RepID=A0A917Q9B0_9HYPH|nr:multidrug effflux MFS transporter [Salinarimonas ramus]GGK37204.1 Bcr/CflA family drug resistance efflux transporter [Salinarimonas ramus]
MTAPRRPPLAILVAISALQPFALNVLAPATPGLSRALSVDYATVQLTLTIYLVAVAATQLFVGPISDRIGRRPCILAGAALFLVGSLVGAAANGIETLILARAIQAAGGGTCFALARAVVRDTASKDESASLIGYITMAMVVSPMVAPLFGGFLDERFGWRAIFVATAILAAGVGVATVMLLGETAPRNASSSIVTTLRGFPTLLRDRLFLAYTLALAFTSAAFFGFIAGAPYVVVETMGRPADVYGAYFILSAGGYMAGNFLTGRFGRRMGTERMIVFGTAASVVTTASAVVLALIGPWTPATLFVPLALNAVANGLSIPSATAAALSVRPDLAGTAAGLAGSTQLGTGALAAFVVGDLVTRWAPSLVVIMFACTGAGFACAVMARRTERLRAKPAA